MSLKGSAHSYHLTTGKYFKGNEPFFFCVHSDIPFLWSRISTGILGEDSGYNSLLAAYQLTES